MNPREEFVKFLKNIWDYRMPNTYVTRSFQLSSLHQDNIYTYLRLQVFKDFRNPLKSEYERYKSGDTGSNPQENKDYYIHLHAQNNVWLYPKGELYRTDFNDEQIMNAMQNLALQVKDEYILQWWSWYGPHLQRYKKLRL